MTRSNKISTIENMVCIMINPQIVLPPTTSQNKEMAIGRTLCQ